MQDLFANSFSPLPSKDYTKEGEVKAGVTFQNLHILTILKPDTVTR